MEDQKEPERLRSDLVTVLGLDVFSVIFWMPRMNKPFLLAFISTLKELKCLPADFDEGFDISIEQIEKVSIEFLHNQYKNGVCG